MKHLKFKKGKILTIVLFMFYTSFIHGQTLVTITYVNDSNYIYSLSPSGKLWFSSTELIINTSDTNSPIYIPILEIRKITFNDNDPNTESNQIVKNNETISIYPNPTNDYFDIVAPNYSKLKISIFDTNGAMLISEIYENEKRVDVSNLSKGIYIVVVNNQSFKLIKQ